MAGTTGRATPALRGRRRGRRREDGGGGRLITFLSDFGDGDGYTGAVKGVLAAQAPASRVVDLAHGVAPGDILGAAFIWPGAVAPFPAGTVHLGVVDPGVGTGRRAVAVELGPDVFVAPDNGLLTGILEARSGPGRGTAIDASRLEEPEPCPTFHGRDVFAPAAARLARGDPLESLGPALGLETLVRLPGFHPEATPGGLRGRVMAVDRFGNLRTNIPGHAVGATATVVVHDPRGQVVARIQGLVSTYGDVAEGALAAYRGSAGTVEVGMRGASAAAHLGCGAACVVEVAG